MTAYVEQLGRRDDIAELIKRHFEIIRAFLPNDEASGAHSCAGQFFGSHTTESPIRVRTGSKHREMMQKITTAIRSTAESSDSARDCGILKNLIAINRAARAKAKFGFKRSHVERERRGLVPAVLQ